MESNKPGEELKRTDLPIRGMSCASCGVRIEKGRSSLEGVSQANVNFAAEKATVFFHPDQTEVSRMVEKVEELGAGARTEKILLPVQGMTCASCVKRVEKALGSVKGVVRADVNFATSRASVEYLPGEATVRDLKQAVEEAGHHVLDVKEEDIVERERLAREEAPARL